VCGVGCSVCSESDAAVDADALPQCQVTRSSLLSTEMTDSQPDLPPTATGSDAV